MTIALDWKWQQNSAEGAFGAVNVKGVNFRTGGQRNEIRWPDGTYAAKIYNSPRAGHKVYLLEGIPGHDYVEIHILTFFGDEQAGWQDDSEGCISVGVDVGPLTNKAGALQWGLVNSRIAFWAFMGLCDNEDLSITFSGGQNG